MNRKSRHADLGAAGLQGSTNPTEPCLSTAWTVIIAIACDTLCPHQSGTLLSGRSMGEHEAIDSEFCTIRVNCLNFMVRRRTRKVNPSRTPMRHAPDGTHR